MVHYFDFYKDRKNDRRDIDSIFLVANHLRTKCKTFFYILYQLIHMLVVLGVDFTYSRWENQFTEKWKKVPSKLKHLSHALFIILLVLFFDVELKWQDYHR